MKTYRLPSLLAWGSLLAGAGTLVSCAAGTGAEATASAPAPADTTAPNWPDAETLARLGQPVGVGVAPGGEVLIFHRGRAEAAPLLAEDPLVAVDPVSGATVGSFGGGYFAKPHGMHVAADGAVWLTDIGRHVVYRFSPEGELLLTLGTPDEPGADGRHFDQPTDVAVAPDGEVFVTDGYGNRRVARFSAAGAFLGAWGREGDGPGEFLNPHAVDVDAAGRVYVSDRDNARVQVFDREGTLLEAFATEAPVYACVADAPRGRLVTTDYLVRDTTVVGSRISARHPGSPASPADELLGRAEAPNGAPCRYHDVCVAPDGTLYAADLLSEEVHRVRR